MDDDAEEVAVKSEVPLENTIDFIQNDVIITPPSSAINTLPQNQFVAIHSSSIQSEKSVTLDQIQQISLALQQKTDNVDKIKDNTINDKSNASISGADKSCSTQNVVQSLVDSDVTKKSNLNKKSAKIKERRKASESVPLKKDVNKKTNNEVSEDEDIPIARVIDRIRQVCIYIYI